MAYYLRTITNTAWGDNKMNSSNKPSTFTIATFNIRTWRAFDGTNSWFLRRRSTLQAIRAPEADIIALQEVHWKPLRYIRKRFSDFEVVSAGRDDGHRRGEHCSVLVRSSRFEIEGSEVRWFSPTPWKAGSRDPSARHPRIATILRLRDRRTNLCFRFANVHLDHSSDQARQRAICDLAGYVQATDEACVLTGDFNCKIDDSALEPLWSLGFTDTLKGVPAEGANAATCHSFTGQIDGFRIDHVLVSNHIKTVEASIRNDRPHGRLPSDHWLVQATIELA